MYTFEARKVTEVRLSKDGEWFSVDLLLQVMAKFDDCSYVDTCNDLNCFRNLMPPYALVCDLVWALENIGVIKCYEDELYYTTDNAPGFVEWLKSQANENSQIETI